jgi:hypothetical protein
MKPIAIPIDVAAAEMSPPPPTSASSTARYTAMKRSSYTSVPSTGALSSFATHPRSMSDLVMMADEEMYTIPAKTKAGTKLPKRTKPSTSPAPKLRTRSAVPALPMRCLSAMSRSRLNSSPRKKRRNTMPSSAPSSMKWSAPADSPTATSRPRYRWLRVPPTNGPRTIPARM